MPSWLGYRTTQNGHPSPKSDNDRYGLRVVPRRIVFIKNKTNHRTIDSTQTVIGPSREVLIRTTLVAEITTLLILMGRIIVEVLIPRQIRSVKARIKARVVSITTDRLLTTERGGITLIKTVAALHKGLLPILTTLTTAQIFDKKPRPTSQLHKQENAWYVPSLHSNHSI